ncbi:MAG: hypothetical protein EYC69_04555 [Bacteroidetes bacterium]|nr:MAG: hypothetical protein EYC69_04555 [Bacteroidota bacterium]
MQRIRKYFLHLMLLSGVLFCQEAFSQNSSTSPYSRYGIGDLLFSGFAKNLGMGGIGQGLNQGLYLNPINPASYSSLWLTTYEAGIQLSTAELATKQLSQNVNTAALGYFAFGFPVKTQKWGMGFGLLPYSNVGYSVEEYKSENLLIPENHTFKGSGGLNQFYLTNGFALTKNFSAGLTASYLFGVINQDRRVEFFDAAYFNTNISNANSLGWFHFNLGLQYTFDSLRIAPSDSIRSFNEKIKTDKDSLKKLDVIIATQTDGEDKSQMLIQRSTLDSTILANLSARDLVKIRSAKSNWNLNFGLTFAPASNLRGRQSVLAYNFRYVDPTKRDQVVIRDTIQNTSGVKGEVHLPVSAGFGFSMTKGNRWLFGADFSLQQWSDYTYFGQSDSLVDSWKVSVGGQFTPNDRSIKSYWKQVQYRAGIHYAKSFLDLNGEHLEEMGASLGLGFPVRRAGTTAHLSAEFGKRGTLQNNLIEEKYFRLTIGFTLNDRWFIKPKYD